MATLGGVLRWGAGSRSGVNLLEEMERDLCGSGHSWCPGQYAYVLHAITAVKDCVE